jgi:hypothetical protein
VKPLEEADLVPYVTKAEKWKNLDTFETRTPNWVINWKELEDMCLVHKGNTGEIFTAIWKGRMVLS